MEFLAHPKECVNKYLNDFNFVLFEYFWVLVSDCHA